MHNPHALRAVALAALGTLSAVGAFADEGGYGYGGLSVGQGRGNVDENRIANTLLDQSLTTTEITRNERDTAYKLFGGYKFNRYFGVEGGYFDLGRYGFTATTVPAGSFEGKLRVRGFNADLLGTLPLTENLSALGRVGIQMARTRATFTGTGAVVPVRDSASERQANAKIGVGLQYEFNPSFQMRVEAERYRVSDAVGQHARVNVYTVSAVFPFGRAAAPAPRAAYSAPVYVAPPVVQAEPAPAPAPPPVVVAVAPPPAVVAPPPRQRVSYSAESMFGFDRSELRPEGKAALDRFANDLKGVRFETITVEGHTDRLGTEAYNQTLSMQRAEAVKQYLVSSGGVDAGRISAVGKSETEPVTGPNDCKGRKPNAALIACLQPDRRVDIEVVGSR